jgi:pilus assembly protein CpaE
VITVMSGKAGSGKTITATNLAAALSEHAGEDQVAIVDGDLQSGDVALMLKLDPTRTIVEASEMLEDMTEARLDGCLLRHDSGMRVLAAPLVPASAARVRPKALLRVVEMLRGMFPYVVVDTPAISDDGLLSLLEHSDHVLMVVDMDLPGVKNTKIALDTLKASRFPMERVHVVLNRSNSKARLDLAELERSLGEEIAATIPSDRLVPESVNEGVPAVALSPRSRVAKSFAALARMFV